jgi:hypothetical protein
LIKSYVVGFMVDLPACQKQEQVLRAQRARMEKGKSVDLVAELWREG